MSPLEFFNSEEDFKRGMEKVIALCPKITNSNVRDICRNEKASSRINNFPPRVAMTVIRELFPNNYDVDVIDPTHGFSGRLIGAYCSGHVNRYVGIDISEKIHKGALKTKKWLNGIDSDSLLNGLGKPTTQIDLYNDNCLEWMSAYKGNGFDMLLTSPPFLDEEQYEGVAFETDYGIWIRDFIGPFIKGAYNVLKVGGKMSVYIEKIKKEDFPLDFTQVALNNGFKKCESIKFKMSYGENNRSDKSARNIPVLVFEKVIEKNKLRI